MPKLLNQDENLTVQDILQLFKKSSEEAKQRSKELEEQRKKDQAEAKQLSKELEEQRKKDKAEAKQQAKEFEEQRKKDKAEAKQQAKQQAKELEEQRKKDKKDKAEAKQRSKEIDERWQKTEEGINKLYKSTQQHSSYIHNASSRLEEFFRKAIKNNDYRVGEVLFDDIQGNISRSNKKGSAIEIDGLLTNGSVVAMLEVKTTLHAKDIDKIKNKIPKFRHHFREYADKQLLVIVAGDIVHHDARTEAHDLGFIILTPDGQQITIDNSHQRTY